MSNKLCFSAIKPSTEQWHVWLGHPSFKIVGRVLSSNNLPFMSNKNSVSHVCDACQQTKSHQLPFPMSISISKAPLELVFSDVWGPGPSSVGRNNYYVSFIDDFSKFTWVYLLKHKSEVFQKFKDFQADGAGEGGEYHKLSSFFEHVGITHLVPCPHTHQ
jgi:hypothetical protein